MCLFLLFFKQKTAYEMRISDWSSDVCSSDLLATKPWVKTSLAPGSQVVTDYLEAAGLQGDLDALGFDLVGYGCTTCIGNSGPLAEPIHEAIEAKDLAVGAVLRSEEHTSELQSLMRISYAVFCLKKKKKKEDDIICADN